MAKLYIGSAYDPTTVITSENKTVREVYEENDINIPNAAMVTLNSRRLGDAELDKTIEELGVVDNDSITITEKYSSANKVRG